MSTNTSTSTTGKTGTEVGSPARPRRVVGEQVVAVRFGAWGPQDVAVRAYSGGGHGEAPYLAVQVGSLLTYAYDAAAVESAVSDWAAAERLNAAVRLPEFTPTTAALRHTGQDLSVLCSVTAEQRSTITSSTGADGRPVITVTVGAVTVDVHTTTALRSHLTAWRKAATVTGMLENTRPASRPAGSPPAPPGAAGQSPVDADKRA